MTSRKRAGHPVAAVSAPPEAGRARRPTINDIARLANVSKKTVSRVINESPFVRGETREKISAIIAELGFVPDPQARGLAFRRSFLIGMIYDSPTPQYIVSMQQGILDAMKGTSFELVIRPCSRQDPGFLSDMRAFIERHKLFGVVLPPPVSEDERLIAILDETECPYVRIASIALDMPDSMVVTHDHIGGLEAARHLVKLGHARIAHISGPSLFRSAHERRRGFAQGLGEAGLKLSKALDREAAYSFESGIESAAALLALEPRPTAIFCGNDEMAAGVYKAARDAGLVIPRDLSVVGYDDSALASRLYPLLTTVRLPIRDMGRMAAAKLIATTRERRTNTGDKTEIVPTLVVRESTAAPPK
ncbi:MAG: LacI family DNA-binding transcriptional regulator [Rhizomicrobium sp.]